MKYSTSTLGIDTTQVAAKIRRSLEHNNKLHFVDGCKTEQLGKEPEGVELSDRELSMRHEPSARHKIDSIYDLISYKTSGYWEKITTGILLSKQKISAERPIELINVYSSSPSQSYPRILEHTMNHVGLRYWTEALFMDLVGELGTPHCLAHMCAQVCPGDWYLGFALNLRPS